MGKVSAPDTHHFSPAYAGFQAVPCFACQLAGMTLDASVRTDIKAVLFVLHDFNLPASKKSLSLAYLDQGLARHSRDQGIISLQGIDTVHAVRIGTSIQQREPG